MPNPYIGQIQVFGFNFAPRSWALCNGQLLPIAQHTALFSLLGTYYGGDGRTTFALPNLKERTAINYGRGPGLSTYSIGEVTGQKDVTLTVSNLPSHNHTAHGSDKDSDSMTPVGNVTGTVENALYLSPANVAMNSQMIANSGGNQAHNNMQPYLINNWCICMQGEYPSRS